MGKLFLIPLLLCLTCSAQLPVIPVALLSAKPPITAASFVPGMAEMWEFTNNSVTTNATVTNWIGQIQSTVLTNGNASDRPTNSSSGVGFSGGSGALTNIPLAIGSNWTITVFYNHDGYDGGHNNTILGNKSTLGNFGLGHIFASASAEVTEWILANGSAAGGGSQFQIANGTMNDITYAMSNNVGSAGISTLFVWTNGVFQRSGSGETASETISAVGYLSAGPGAYCFGHLEGIYIQTQYVATASSTSNLHYWRTNYLTHGASP